VLLTVGLAQLAHRVDLGWRTSLLVLLLHALLTLAPLAGSVAWRARVEVRVLAGIAADALPAQVVAQVLVLVLALTGTASTPHPWLRLLGVAAAAGLALGMRAVLAVGPQPFVRELARVRLIRRNSRGAAGGHHA
jgi:hypothetical protein